MKKRTLIFHPLLFAAAPVLDLYILNGDLVPLRDAVELLVGVLLLTAALWFGLGMLFRRRWERAALLTSLIVFTALRYASVYPAPDRLSMAIKLLLWLALLCLVAYLLNRSRRDPGRLTAFLNVLSLVWFVATFSLWAYAALGDRGVAIARGEAYIADWQQASDELAAANAGPSSTSPPDIYYIVLDGYARSDLLQDIYSYDNSEFLNFLRAQGFYVAERSVSNYAQTALSQASTLNFDYLDDLAQSIPSGSTNRLPLGSLIESNRVFQLLRQRGYRIVTFSSGYLFTDVKANVERHEPPGNLGALPLELLRMTPLPAVSSVLASYSLLDMQRDHILYTLQHLPERATGETPAFVYAHILAPHPPFVFGAAGEPLEADEAARLDDGNLFISRYGREKYLEGYRAQTAYISNRVRQLVQQILAQARRPTIIVIQADHGPGSRLDWANSANTDFRERFSILNAYYFPDQAYGELYPEISPVNTFRVILKNYFGIALPVLEDRSYFSTLDRPYDFSDVTEAVGATLGTD